MGQKKGVSRARPRCVYCGRKPMPSKPGWPRVCRLCADLPLTDPNYLAGQDVSGPADTLRP